VRVGLAPQSAVQCLLEQCETQGKQLRSLIRVLQRKD
jgi:hypothetical protein